MHMYVERMYEYLFRSSMFDNIAVFLERCIRFWQIIVGENVQKYLLPHMQRCRRRKPASRLLGELGELADHLVAILPVSMNRRKKMDTWRDDNDGVVGVRLSDDLLRGTLWC